MSAADLEVLLCDNHLLAVAKPACLPTVPDASGDDSLLERARRFVEREFAKPGKAYLGVVQRLDRPVSGVVLFARTSKAAERLTAQFRARTVSKRYLAIALALGGAGTELDAGEGRLEQWLVKDHAANRVRVSARPGGAARAAVTRWRVLARRGSEVLLELEPETGRPHQLRVAMSSLGLPLVGDLKYGAHLPLSDKSIALHALRLEIEHPTRAERVAIECPVPDREWWALARERRRTE